MIIFCLYPIRGACAWYVGSYNNKGIFIGEQHDNYGEAAFGYMRAKLPNYVIKTPISFTYSENPPHPDEKDYICFNIAKIKSYQRRHFFLNLDYDEFLNSIEPTLQKFGINYFDDDNFDREKFEPLTEHETVWGVEERPLDYHIFTYGYLDEENLDGKYSVNFTDPYSLKVKDHRIYSTDIEYKYTISLQDENVHDDLLTFILDSYIIPSITEDIRDGDIEGY